MITEQEFDHSRQESNIADDAFPRRLRASQFNIVINHEIKFLLVVNPARSSEMTLIGEADLISNFGG
jgi:hypothetical protein